MDKHESKSRHAQLLRRVKNRMDNLLNMDVLDSETRQLLVREAMPPLQTPSSRLNLPNIIRMSSAHSPSSASKPSLTPLKAQKGEHPKTNDSDEAPTSYLRARVKSGSGDLITSMAMRLKELEKTHKIYQNELKEMHKKYHELQVSFQKESQKCAEAEGLLVELYDEKKHLEELIHRQRANAREDACGDPAKDAPPAPWNTSTSPVDVHEEERGVSPREASPCSDHIRITAERGVVDPRDLPSSPPGAERVMLFNPSPRGGMEGREGDAARARRRPSVGLEPLLDVPLMIRNARVLSDHVGWKAVVVADGQGRIANREIVSVVVYKNGISVNNGAFRPFTWSLCKAFVQDLMEGYYPYEFKDRYPGGFPIEVIDKSSEDWHPPADKPKPVAAGNAVSNPFPRNVHSLQEMQNPLDKERFLQELPATKVTANGHVVRVRGTIASLLQEGGWGPQGPKAENHVSDTIRHATVAERAHHTTSAGVKTQGSKAETPDNDVAAMGDLISLLIRLPSGGKVVMRMSPDDTIEQLHRELLAAAPEIMRTYAAFEFCQAFPFRLYHKREETLKKLGLSGNRMLLLRAVK
ncbi:unnamed protein product [Phytomonas sp. EM1]|nr:unnamed protein product [Phytomonas sp. EM1]|eukprot:CCW63329.1 unnamed protein product [Phytomonas sp. isolate EM1]